MYVVKLYDIVGPSWRKERVNKDIAIILTRKIYFYGAKQAFQAAWAAACQVEASTIIVPSEYNFLVGPISFSGPHCQKDIVFQVNGDIFWKK